MSPKNGFKKNVLTFWLAHQFLWNIFILGFHNLTDKGLRKFHLALNLPLQFLNLTNYMTILYHTIVVILEWWWWLLSEPDVLNKKNKNKGIIVVNSTIVESEIGGRARKR